jgi:peptidoglycan-N-acetylmuramic acid deacetylase
MAAEGHIVGNHTLHHPDMSAISDRAAFQKELEGLSALYEETVGSPMPMYYRPPQGKYSEENLKMAQALGYKTILWSLAYVDWYVDDQPTAEQAYSKLLPRIHNGAIVLLHSTSQTNAEILDELLTKWEDMGFTFASLDELPTA